jgi:predicted dehydrogenase
MIEACESANVKLGVTLQRRAEEPFRSLREAVAAGELGRLVCGSVTVPYYRPQDYYDSAAWRGTREMDGGALMNQGIHLVDLLVWCMGDPVSAAAVAGTLVHDMESEDTISAALSFSGGEVASVSATTAASPGFPHRIEVYGTAGGIQIEGEKIVRWETTGQVSKTEEDADMPGDAGSGRDPMALSVDGHASVYRDFVGAIREDRHPAISGEEGRRSLSAVLMMYQSAGLVSEGP